MEAESIIRGQYFRGLGGFLRKCLFNVLSVGPIPAHISFIMDGNRRYARKNSLEEGEGHKAGFSSLLSMLNYCYELGIKYVTIYAFSIDNFKRKPNQVQYLMNLMMEKMDQLLQQESIVNQYGIRVVFVGDLNLLNDTVRAASERVMKATENNTKGMLLVAVAYTSTDEMAHAIEESFKEKFNEVKKDSNFAVEGNEGKKMNGLVEQIEKSAFTDQGKQISEGGELAIKTVDVEKHMYMAVAPAPDIMIRSSGETRLSNFLTWQTAYSPLYAPKALWPELGLWHLVWAVLIYQRSYTYLEKRRKQN